MTRIASLFVAAALLLTAAPSFAQDSTPSVRSQAYAVAMALTEVERGLQTARVELNKAWAEARTIKGELSEWRAGDQVTSDEGQERIRVLEADLRVAKNEIRRLQSNKAYTVANKRSLKTEQKELVAEIAREQRNRTIATGRSVNRSSRAAAMAAPGRARFSQ